VRVSGVHAGLKLAPAHAPSPPLARRSPSRPDSALTRKMSRKTSGALLTSPLRIRYKLLSVGIWKRGLIHGRDAMNWFTDILEAAFGVIPAVILGLWALLGMVLGWKAD